MSLTQVSAILGFSGVVFGAFGSHALKDRLTAGNNLRSWDIATKYHLIHAATMFATSLFLRLDRNASPRLQLAVKLWGIGIFLFSGSIYALSLGGPRVLGPVTPVGGLFLMAGWLAAASAGL
jgi:uncharacterized membrane protein YgdD (TMEM256/DUF423 family)